jgi:hypothetical protein
VDYAGGRTFNGTPGILREGTNVSLSATEMQKFRMLRRNSDGAKKGNAEKSQLHLEFLKL